MPIGKSKISDMDFGSFENTVDKNIETDKASDKFDQQLRAYKDAGNSLTSAKSGVEMATASMHEAKDKLSEASDKANTVTQAIEAYIGKVKDITVKAKVDDADMEQAINNRKKLIENESKLLEDHRKKNKEILLLQFQYFPKLLNPHTSISHFHTDTTGIPSSVPSSSYVINRHFQSWCALAYFTSGGSSLL